MNQCIEIGFTWNLYRSCTYSDSVRQLCHDQYMQFCRITGCSHRAVLGSTLCQAHIDSGREHLMVGPYRARRMKVEQSPPMRHRRSRKPAKPAKPAKPQRPCRITNIYAIRMGNFVKFGRAGSAEQRIRDLQIGCPEKLSLIACIEANAAVETRIHRALKPLNVQGEWFRLAEEAEQVVELIKAGDLSPLLEWLTQRLRRA